MTEQVILLGGASVRGQYVEQVLLDLNWHRFQHETNPETLAERTDLASALEAGPDGECHYHGAVDEIMDFYYHVDDRGHEWHFDRTDEGDIVLFDKTSADWHSERCHEICPECFYFSEYGEPPDDGDPDWDRENAEAGLDGLEVSIIPESLLGYVADGDDVVEFSNAPCDICGDASAGKRYKVIVWNPKAED